MVSLKFKKTNIDDVFAPEKVGMGARWKIDIIEEDYVINFF